MNDPFDLNQLDELTIRSGTDTPETDEFHEKRPPLPELATAYLLMADHARRLERERDEARRVATQYADAYGGAFDLPWETIPKPITHTGDTKGKSPKTSQA